MKFIKSLIVTSIAIVLVSCGARAALANSPANATTQAPDAPGRAQIAQAVQVMATATMDASTPTPAIDYDATIQALSTQSAVDKLASIKSRADELSARETANAAGVAALAITATMSADKNATSLQLSSDSLTSQAVKLESDKLVSTQISIIATKTAEAPVLIMKAAQAEANAKTETARAWAGIAFPYAVSAFIVFGLFAGFVYWSSNRPAPVAPVFVAEPQPEAPAALPVFPGGLSLKNICQRTGIEAERLVKMAGMLPDLAWTHDNFTPAEVCMSEGKFSSLQYVLVGYGAARWNDETHQSGATLTSLGTTFFADLLNPTTSPFKNDAPVTPSASGYRPIPGRNDAEGAGERS